MTRFLSVLAIALLLGTGIYVTISVPFSLSAAADQN